MEAWSDGVLAGYDCETNGVDPEHARIVSAALVINDPANSDDNVYTWLANPGVDIPLAATAVHGISTDYAREHGNPPAMVVSGILTAFSLVRETYGPIPLVLVNAPYDLTILDREIRRHLPGSNGLELDMFVIDTLTCDRKLDPYRRGRRTLTATAAAYGIAIKGAHTASGDVTCAISLARSIARRYPRFGAASLDRLQDLQRGAHREWSEHFEEYRRKFGDPDFCCNGDWPYRPYVPSETVAS